MGDVIQQADDAPVAVGQKTMFAALRYRNYSLYWWGQLISLVGTWMQIVGQGYLVYKLSSSAFLLGLVGFASQAPVLVLALYAGVIADRLRKRDLMLVTQTGAMLLAFALAYLAQFNLVRIEHIIVLSALLGLVNALDTPVRQSIPAELVDRSDIMNAIALSSSIVHAARALGPALAGILLAVYGPATLFWINGVSYLAVIGGLLLMRGLPLVQKTKRSGGFGVLTEGVNYYRQHPVMAQLLATAAVLSLFGMPYITLMPIFALDILQVGERGLGYLLMVGGLGALLAALFLAWLGNFAHKGKLITVGSWLFPIFLLLFANSRSPWLVYPALLIVGFGMIVQVTVINTTLQQLVPDHLRGRVMSVYTVAFFGMMPVGNLMMGQIAQLVGAPQAVTMGACVLLASATYMMLRWPQVRAVA